MKSKTVYCVQWKNCGKNTSVKFYKFDLKPNPIVIHSYANFTGVIGVNVTQNFTDQIVVKVKVYRLIKIIKLVKIPIPIGEYSEFDLCEVFNSNKAVICPYFDKINVECKCPLKPGNYNIEKIDFMINEVKIPPALKWVSKGNYEVIMEMYHNNTQILCLQVNTALSFK
ncbi:hypothetical protein B4U80_03706 [Leptotrombidium deliense]|uniref:MD-2-related lipid-recognition domain-containing protein n=1 Tax=Leptotrombidium deliense TaxID=299467 RepID=A0A443SI73_9ACAR|nr:hypothetical protein B4U80_03706 [Leptotrombidium deliense]